MRDFDRGRIAHGHRPGRRAECADPVARERILVEVDVARRRNVERFGQHPLLGRARRVDIEQELARPANVVLELDRVSQADAAAAELHRFGTHRRYPRRRQAGGRSKYGLNPLGDGAGALSGGRTPSGRMETASTTIRQPGPNFMPILR